MAETNKQINDSENAKLFRTRMDIFVLNALDEKNGQGYGYDVISYIQDHTKGHYKVKSVSTIYNILKRLESTGYVSASKGDGESYGAARVYYILTPEGKEYLEQYKREWKYIRTLLDNLVSDESFDLDTEEPPYSASVLKPFTKRTREASDFGGEEDVADVSSDDAPAQDEIASAQEASVSVPADEDDTPFYNYADESKPVFTPKEKPDETPAPSFETKAPVDEVTDAVSIQEQADSAEFVLETEEKPVDSIQYKPTASIPKYGDENYTKERKKHFEQARIALFGTSDPDAVPAPGNDFGFAPKSYRPILPDDEVIDPKPSFIEHEKQVSSFEPKVADNDADELTHSLLSPYMEKLRNELGKEGYTLSSFSPAKKSSGIRYLLVNKILRDTFLASFFYLVITLLITNLFKSAFDITPVATFTIGGIGLLFPVVSFLLCLRDPLRKKKDAVNIKLLISVLVLVYVVMFMAVVVYYLFTSKYSLVSSQTYAPAIILSTLPFAGVMFAVLHGSGKYTK